MSTGRVDEELVNCELRGLAGDLDTDELLCAGEFYLYDEIVGESHVEGIRRDDERYKGSREWTLDFAELKDRCRGRRGIDLVLQLQLSIDRTQKGNGNALGRHLHEGHRGRTVWARTLRIARAEGSYEHEPPILEQERMHVLHLAQKSIPLIDETQLVDEQSSNIVN